MNPPLDPAEAARHHPAYLVAAALDPDGAVYFAPRSPRAHALQRAIERMLHGIRAALHAHDPRA